MTSRPPLPPAVSVVRERAADPLEALVHPDWSSEAWLVHGTTRRRGTRDFDMGLFGPGHDEGAVRRNWQELASSVGFTSVVHARQLHGATVHRVDATASGAAGLAGGVDVPHLLAPSDGQLTNRAGVLLTVTTADCVPVFLVDVERRVVGAVHAGWRGVAVGILEGAIERMVASYGSEPGAIRVHLGPAICGQCYEVGPEVFEALGQPAVSGPTPIDVRAVLAGRALQAGVAPANVTVSSHCTRCTGSDLFSHRAGDVQRQVAFIGMREEA